LTVKNAIGVGCGGELLDMPDGDDVVGGEPTIEEVGRGVCGDNGRVIWFGGDAANGV